jgi:hypothetical protein
MKAILVHGMGRTPASQLVLAARLRRRGFGVHLFGYSTFRPFAATVERLAARVRKVAGAGEPFVLVGHSLGCVLIRAALPGLAPLRPLACFFLAPPSRPTRAARRFAGNPLYRLLAREPGQLLADADFMAALPLPPVPVRVYAGTAGFRGRFSPFAGEANDGILAVSETTLPPDHAVVLVPAVHTFIMNARLVADDIAATAAALARAPVPLEIEVDADQG